MCLQKASMRATECLMGLLVLTQCAPTPEVVENPDLLAPLDHFLCYQVATTSPSGATPYPQIGLRDQFWRSSGYENIRPATAGERFCNPVRKEREGEDPSEIQDHDHHLLALDLFGTGTKERQVEVVNQFFGREKQILTVTQRDKQYLMVPTEKVGSRPDGEPHRPPQGLDHFRCYPASGKDPNTPVRLTDQWQWRDGEPIPLEVRVGPPALVCNPTDKRHGDRPPTERLRPDDHLVCYDVEGPADQRFTVHNQFYERPRAGNFHAAALEWLCLPSTKREVEDDWRDPPPPEEEDIS